MSIVLIGIAKRFNKLIWFGTNTLIQYNQTPTLQMLGTVDALTHAPLTASSTVVPRALHARQMIDGRWVFSREGRELEVTAPWARTIVRMGIRSPATGRYPTLGEVIEDLNSLSEHQFVGQSVSDGLWQLLDQLLARDFIQSIDGHSVDEVRAQRLEDRKVPARDGSSAASSAVILLGLVLVFGVGNALLYGAQELYYSADTHRMQALDSDMRVERESLDVESARLAAEDVAIEEAKTLITPRAPSWRIEEINRRIDAYNVAVEAHKESIESYNKKVAEYNELAETSGTRWYIVPVPSIGRR